MSQNYDSAFAYVAALTQSDPNTVVIDARAIHDTNKATAAIPRRGTLPQLWNELCAWNNQGYGIFVNLADMDGNGHEIGNVKTIRCQAIDLDNLSAQQNYERAVSWQPAPSFAVQSSPGKLHVYWQTYHHTNRDGFTLLQRKLRTLFDGDKTIIDPSRVLRLPGTYHLKNPSAPHLITCWALGGYGTPIDPATLEQALAGVNVIDGSGGRHDLGDGSLQAPGWDWCLKALTECDPNSLDRGEWISFTSAWKQAAWNYHPEGVLFDVWSQWCARYAANDPKENLKNWNSIRNTEVGWPSIERRNGSLHALRIFGDKLAEQQQQAPDAPPMPDTSQAPKQIPIPTGEFLTDTEQREWFKGCVAITRMGEILTGDGRFMNATKFNIAYGGKKFIVDSAGKVTNEAWAAATRSSLWTVPKADHIRFLPSRPHGELIVDALRRVGVNTYLPATIDARPGDITPFLNHMALLFPSEIDRAILFEYFAHNVKFPGYKIPWAPMIQSAEGAGKNLIKFAMTHAIGDVYTYEPKAKELIESGSKFNAWMRSKLFILVDEIKTDERRDMIEILKPMISEERIEVQSKGIDQDLEDNFSNWLFFSNFKDAIPVNQNNRRFAIFYSPMQTKADIDARGLSDGYFAWIYKWMRNGGASHVAHWLQNYQIERGSIPMRAPMTTSTVEAVKQSRGPVELAILDAIGDALPGFRGGWVSSLAVANRLKGTNVRHVSAKTLTAIMEALGYHAMGRADRPYSIESGGTNTRTDLYHYDRNARVETFGPAQGYRD